MPRDYNEELAHFEQNSVSEKVALSKSIKQLEDELDDLVVSVTKLDNSSIRERQIRVIGVKEELLKNKKVSLEKIDSVKTAKKVAFITFALEFADRLGSRFFEITSEKREMCKQILFPGGFVVSSDKKVYTTEISPVYSVALTEKVALATLDSNMVAGVGFEPTTSWL